MKTKKPEITTVIKTQLYYDRYEYCVHWSQTGIRNIGHDLDRSQLHETFEAWDHEPEWQSNWHNRTRYLKKPQVRQDLETVQSYLAQQREQGLDFKLVFGWNCVYIYTNDVTVSDVFRHIKSGVRLRITQVQVQGSPDIISLVKPRHSFRTYFRRRELRCAARPRPISGCRSPNATFSRADMFANRRMFWNVRAMPRCATT